MHSFYVRTGKAKVELVTGLKWHPLIPDNFKQELVPLGVQLGSDLYVYRRSDKSIVAMASSNDGYRAGQVPFALLVLERLNRESTPENAIVAVCVDAANDIFALVVIRDGFILAKSDVTGTESEIGKKCSEFLSLFDDWDVLVAPDTWKVRGATQRTVESFLPADGKKGKIPAAWRLKPIKVPFGRTLIKIGGVLLLAAGSVYAYKAWRQHEAQQLASQLAQQQSAIAEAQRLERMNAEPWGQLPGAVAFAAACSEGLNRIGLIATSWSVSDFGCEGMDAYVTWERANKTALISHMRALHPSAVISPDGRTARVTTTLNMKFQPSAKTGEQLPVAGPRFEKFRDIASVYGLSVTIKAPEPRPVPQPGQPTEPPAPWTESEVRIEGPIVLPDMARLFDGPGFRLKKITGKYASGLSKFQLIGAQYAKN